MNDIFAIRFDQPTTEEFWHYCAKHKSSNKFYEKKESLENRMVEIQKKIGENGLNRRAYAGLTPLHVATLLDNRPAISFFLAHGARKDLQDDLGRLPVDYAKSPQNCGLLDSKLTVISNDKDFGNTIDYLVSYYVRFGRMSTTTFDPFSSKEEALSLPTSPSVQVTTAKKIANEWFSRVSSKSQEPFKYQASTNDFGVSIKKLLFSRQDTSSNGVVNNAFVINDMKKIAQTNHRRSF